MITIDGGSGEILAGAVAMIEPELSGDFATLMGWADAARRLKVRANAETALDAAAARRFGAEGIGLVRTEHMFFDPERIAAVREMILADDEAGRRAALAKIHPMQKGDFIACSTSWKAARSPSACSIRRCMSSCRTTRTTWRRWPRPPAWTPPSCCAGLGNCAKPTQCLATAAAVWASPFPRSTRCRCGRSSRRRCEVAASGRPARARRSCIPWSPRARR